MKGLKLDVYQFYLLNYGDWLGLFEPERELVVSNLCEREKENFNPYHFDYKQTKELYKIYEHILISAEDKIMGAIGNKYYFILDKPGIYAFSLSYFNRDLIS